MDDLLKGIGIGIIIGFITTIVSALKVFKIKFKDLFK
jgi:gas vesicle protein